MATRRRKIRKTRMARVENPDSTMSILLPKSAPAIRGHGDSDYTCAGCGKTLLSKVLKKQVQHLVFKCPECGTHSRVPPTTGA